MPGFDEELLTNNDELNIHSNEGINTGDEMTDEELTKLIETALDAYNEEAIIWIYKEFLLFRNDLSDNPRKNYHGFEKLEGFSDFNEIKKNFTQSLKKIKPREEVNKFLLKIENNNKYIFFKTFSKIKDNEILCTFIFNFIKNKNNEKSNFEYHDNIYLHLIHLYFTKKTHTYRKNKIIEEAILYFNNEIKLINKNLSKKFENGDFSSWAYLYLKSVDPNFDQIRYLPIDEKSHQNLINTYLDYLAYSDKIFYENLMNKLNKAWSQKKFRDADKVKKNYHLPLTKQTSKKLKILSEVTNKTESQILEMLIEEHYRIAILDENGKPKY